MQGASNSLASVLSESLNKSTTDLALGRYGNFALISTQKRRSDEIDRSIEIIPCFLKKKDFDHDDTTTTRRHVGMEDFAT